MTIVFVCTGNICRSPMAEYFFRRLTDDLGLDRIQIESAGLAADFGIPCSPQALFALSQEGIGAQEHRSQPLTADLMHRADLIVTMTSAHREAILAQDPGMATKTRTLLSFAGGSGNVSDPYGGSFEDYVHCLALMKPALHALASHLRQQADSAGQE